MTKLLLRQAECKPAFNFLTTGCMPTRRHDDTTTTTRRHDDTHDMSCASVRFSFKFASGKNWSLFYTRHSHPEYHSDHKSYSKHEPHSEIKPALFFELRSLSKNVTVKMSHLLFESYSVENLSSFVVCAIFYKDRSVFTLTSFFESYLACNVCATMIGTLLAIASLVPDFCKQDLCQIKIAVLASCLL